MGMLQKNIKLFACVCGIYVLPVVTAILFAGLSEGIPFDLSQTVSLYVAKYVWTTLLFFACIMVICFLFFQYIRKVELRMVQRVLYIGVILCILGCAWFPCNHSRSMISSDIHDFFSYLLVVFVALTFMAMTIWGRQKRQRVFGLCSLVYAVGFIVAFAFHIAAIKQTIFIWENVLIFLLFGELFLEGDQKRAQVACQ